MDKFHEKRKLPSSIKKILAVDVYLTDQFIKTMEKILFFKQIKTHSRLLEISCHGLIWLPGWVASIWVFNMKDLYQMQVNFFLGLILDILLIALIKSFTRRRRPVQSDSLSEIGPDKFSFPSGHASRALFITFFFLFIWPIHYVFIPSLLCWSISVCISRILMKRHYLLDVIVGAILGIVESYFINFLYISETNCTNIIWWLTDEKLDGGEYHV